MVNSMNIAELHHLYNYIAGRLDDAGVNYLVYEPGVLDLYNKILNGEAGRKDFLIFAIRDMLDCVKENNVEGVKSTLLVRFERLYK